MYGRITILVSEGGVVLVFSGMADAPRGLVYSPTQ